MIVSDQQAAEKRQRVAEMVNNDPHAPLFHFISPEGYSEFLCFDPNGAIFWKGRYHIFYIFQDPARKVGTEFRHAGHCWGHASSADLLHWTFHPTALVAEPGDPETAIYSGCALINKEGVPTIVYHGCDAGTCIATPLDDDLICWRKSPHNPVIPETKEGEPGWGVYNVFDPHVWLEDDTYYAILGGMVKPDDLRDTAYLFTSPDLVHWEYQHPFYTPNPDWTGEHEDCACPDFFPLGDRHALVCISHVGGSRCYLGDYRDGALYPTEHYRLNWPGGACHAPETLLDGNGRRLFWAWTIEGRSTDGKGLGLMTMPRVLSLDAGGTLQITPPAEFASLRRNHRRVEHLTIPAGAEIPLPEIDGDCLEIALEAEVSGSFTLKLRVSPDGEEETAITCDPAARTLTIDTTRASLAEGIFRPSPIWDPKGDPSQDVPVQVAPFAMAAGEPLRLRIFLDRSMLEVFANDRLCLTQRIYPTRQDSIGVRLAAQAPATILSLDAWDMEPVNAYNT